jgi:ribosome biogenesis SPOUT family RNA methylase Rps3
LKPLEITPTVLLGGAVGVIKPRLREKELTTEKVYGIILA